MITQGIKRWLKNLFAWWHWGRMSAANYVQATSTTVQGTQQETLFFPTAEGLSAQPTQPSTTSVAIERLEEEPTPESGRLIAEEPSPTKTSFIQPSIDESINILEEKPKTKQEAVHTTQELLTPTTEQRLEFLRYLVERGIVNEGDTNKS
jgi:hypothetical protein